MTAITERHLRIRLGEVIDAALNAQVHALDRWLQAQPILHRVAQWPAYTDVLMEVEPGFADDACVAVQSGLARWAGQDSDVLIESEGVFAHGATPIDIPVSMAAADAPDLALCAASCGMDVSVWRTQFLATTFQVALIGFQPGFPYLLGLDSRLAVPRRSAPRRVVPAGSVAIAGTQAGIYPADSPGGWQLVGRTAVRLFDPERDPPCWLAPGQTVRFVCMDGPQP